MGMARYFWVPQKASWNQNWAERVAAELWGEETGSSNGSKVGTRAQGVGREEDAIRNQRTSAWYGPRRRRAARGGHPSGRRLEEKESLEAKRSWDMETRLWVFVTVGCLSLGSPKPLRFMDEPGVERKTRKPGGRSLGNGRRDPEVGGDDHGGRQGGRAPDRTPGKRVQQSISEWQLKHREAGHKSWGQKWQLSPRGARTTTAGLKSRHDTTQPGR